MYSFVSYKIAVETPRWGVFPAGASGSRLERAVNIQYTCCIKRHQQSFRSIPFCYQLFCERSYNSACEMDRRCGAAALHCGSNSI
jgi:hypothetical protein